MKEYFEYTFAELIRRVFLILPEPAGKLAIKALVPLVRFLLYKRHRMMLKNLRLAFPGKSRQELMSIASRVWFNVGWGFIDALRYINSPGKILTRVKIKDPEKFRKLLSGKTIVVSAHVGNWEILAQRLVLEGYKFGAVVRSLRNRAVDRKITVIRESLGGRAFLEHQVGKIFSWLKNGDILYILPDHHIAEGGLRVDFLGRPAFTSPIITLLNKRTGCKIVPVFCVRNGRNYEIYTEDEFVPHYTGNLRQDMSHNTEGINKVIEKYIRTFPEQWMWLHNRWKEK
ncbi:MAG: lysophospholipid acyltransferase family protein [Elusimicrobiota bacterium]